MAEAIGTPRLAARARRILRQVGTARLIGTTLLLVLALLSARFSWHMPLASDAERALYDIRHTLAAPRVAQDDRIVLVVYNDETLAQLGKRSPLDRQMLAGALTALDDMNPKAIGIDILIDQEQPEDAVLTETFRTIRTPTYLAYASHLHNPDHIQYWQEEFLRAFVKKASGGALQATSIKLEPDLEDGVIRRWPRQAADLPPLMANSLAPMNAEFRNYTRSIVFRLPESDDFPVFTSLPIQLVAEYPELVREAIEDRYVLIGGDIQDLDDFNTPMSRGTGRPTKGLEVHAHLLAQLLDRNIPPPIPEWGLLAVAVAVVAAGALTSMLNVRGWQLMAILLGQAVFFVGLPFALQWAGRDTLDLPAFGWGVGWAFAFIGVGTAARAVGVEQKRFAQSALGKYLPVDIATQILRDPDRLALRGEKKQIYALFTDLEGFTKLSHSVTPEQLSTLLNRYLDAMSETVLQHGGTIDKFVGDAVVAFWGAPIARDDDADRATQAALAMYEAGEQFRRSAGAEIPPIGCTRVGLHRGEAVVGNFGGEGRIQYTALGDGMNTAARLESANKALKTTILVSEEARRETTFDLFRPMGRIVLSGRATPVVVWEPAPWFSAEDRARLADLWSRFDAGEGRALAGIESIAAAHSDDAALQNFVYRVREVGSGGHYVLGSK